MYCHKYLFHIGNHMNHAGCVCLWKQFPDKVLHQKTLKKKRTWLFVGAGWSFFTKSKTETYYWFFHYCNSSVEYWRLSALKEKFFPQKGLYWSSLSPGNITYMFKKRNRRKSKKKYWGERHRCPCKDILTFLLRHQLGLY